MREDEQEGSNDANTNGSEIRGGVEDRDGYGADPLASAAVGARRGTSPYSPPRRSARAAASLQNKRESVRSHVCFTTTTHGPLLLENVAAKTQKNNPQPKEDKSYEKIAADSQIIGRAIEMPTLAFPLPTASASRRNHPTALVFDFLLPLLCWR